MKTQFGEKSRKIAKKVQWKKLLLFYIVCKKLITLFHCTAHFSTVFCTVKKMHNKNHYCQNIIFDHFWTFLINLEKIRKKSENLELIFFTQWNNYLFHWVKKTINSLSEIIIYFTEWKKQLFHWVKKSRKKWSKNRISKHFKMWPTIKQSFMLTCVYNSQWDP